MCFSCPSLSLSCFLSVSLLVVLLNSKETQAELGWTSYPPNGVSLHCVCVCVCVCKCICVSSIFSSITSILYSFLSYLSFSLSLSRWYSAPYVYLTFCLPACLSVRLCLPQNHFYRTELIMSINPLIDESLPGQVPSSIPPDPLTYCHG